MMTIACTRRLLRWAVLPHLLFLFLPLSCVQGDRVANPVFQYEFTRSQCLAGVFKDAQNSSWGSIPMLLTPNVTCLSALGVKGVESSSTEPRLQSTGTSQTFSQWMSDSWSSTFKGFSMEAWIKNYDAATSDKYPIMTISDRNGTNTGTYGNYPDCSSHSNMELSRYKSRYYLELYGSSKLCFSAQTGTGYTMTAGKVEHVVVTLDKSIAASSGKSGYVYVKFYVNTVLQGTSWLTIGSNNMGAVWRNDSVLNLMGRTATGSTYHNWPGEMYMAAMYGSVLSVAEVSQNYAAGFSNSPPEPDNVVTTISEDGEVGSHYDNSSYYLTIIAPNELVVLNLTASDVDQDPSFPNYVSGAAGSQLWVNSLPRKGQLFDLSGVAITSVPYQLDVTDSKGTTFSVRYRPAKDEYTNATTTYDSFTCYAVDGYTGITSTTNATVTINVMPKNDPPVPVDATVTAVAGVSENWIYLGDRGTDIDVDDYIYAFQVVSLPSSGKLYKVDSSKKVDKNSTVTVGEILPTFYVVYQYTGNSSTSDSKGLVTTDEIKYLVYDNHNVSSATPYGSLKVAVYSGLSALTANDMNNTSWKVYEDTASEVKVYASDRSSFDHELKIVISALPIYGTIWDAVTKVQLQVNQSLTTRIQAPYKSGVGVLYTAQNDYFSTPTSTWSESNLAATMNDSFSFYATSSGGGDSLVSDIATQVIQIQNVNDAVVLACPAEHYNVKAVAAVLASSSNVNAADREDQAKVSSFQLNDTDLNVDAVRVNIVALYGIMTFNDEYLSYLDFTTKALCYSKLWQCAGDGRDDSSMSFVAEPQWALKALNSLTYTSYMPNVEDVVTVTVYDGAGGQCIAESNFRSSSLRSACLQISCSFNVTVGGFNYNSVPENNDSNIKVSKSWFEFDLPLQAWVGIGAGVVVFVGCLLSRVLLCLCTMARLKHSEEESVELKRPRGSSEHSVASDDEIEFEYDNNAYALAHPHRRR